MENKFDHFLKTKEEIEEWLNDLNEVELFSGSVYFINDDLTVDVEGKIEINNLKLKYFPVQFNIIKGDFICSYSNLITLKGAPIIVKGNFDCSHCDFLKSLEYAPKFVCNNFYCNHCNSLITLEGAPEYVLNSFYAHHCKNLQSLKGAPRYVHFDFNCNDCDSLKSIENKPQYIGRFFYYYNTPVYNLKEN